MSKVTIPYLTLQRIEELLVVDQGARFRELSKETLPLCEDAYRGEDSPFRSHLGASLIGHECTRQLWYSFRWFKAPKHEGRLLRLFNRGHLEEGRFVALLRMIGCEVWSHQADGNQFRIEAHHGHFGGALDCVLRGIVEWPTLAILGEFKTHGLKSFVRLAGSDWKDHLKNPQTVAFSGDGVRLAKFEHFVQMQSYMGLMGLPWALYLAVCKDDDSIYAELIQFDPTIFEVFLRRADDIIRSPIPLARIKEDSSWWLCKGCKMRGPCWEKEAPAVNCRTCRHSRVTAEGWKCSPQNLILSEGEQLAACDFHDPTS